MPVEGWKDRTCRRNTPSPTTQRGQKRLQEPHNHRRMADAFVLCRPDIHSRVLKATRLQQRAPSIPLRGMRTFDPIAAARRTPVFSLEKGGYRRAPWNLPSDIRPSVHCQERKRALQSAGHRALAPRDPRHDIMGKEGWLPCFTLQDARVSWECASSHQQG